MTPTATTRRYAQLAAVLAVLAAGLIALAARNRGPEFAEVEGTVTLDGKPLADVEVQFLPDPEKSNPGPTASAYTDAAGHYKLRCEKMSQDGAVLGPHRVCVIDITAIAPLGPPGLAPPSLPGPATVSQKPKLSRVPAVYNDPTRTPFRDVEVKSGKQTLDFNVKSGKRK
jgi:hypothetical protein